MNTQEVIEKRRLLLDALDSLPDKYRTPLVMHYFEGQSAVVIGQHLALSADAVRARLKRGRDQLRDEFYRYQESLRWEYGHGGYTGTMAEKTDLQFITERLSRKGQVTPKDAIVLHPFGRYCNAFKSAGEVDVLEAIGAVRREYSIDSERIALSSGRSRRGSARPSSTAPPSPSRAVRSPARLRTRSIQTFRAASNQEGVSRRFYCQRDCRVWKISKGLVDGDPH